MTAHRERVGLCVLIQGLQFGGLERVAVDLVNHLPKRYDVTLCCFDALGPLEDLVRPEVDVVLLERRQGFDPAYPRKLARLLRERRAGVLNVHNNTAFFYGALASLLARDTRLVYTEHGRTERLSWKARAAHRLLARRVARTIVVTPHLADVLARDEGFPRDRIDVVPNGVADPGPRDLAAQPDVRTLAELGAAPGDPLVGIVARLDPVKNVALLLRAFRRVVADVPSARLAIVGDGPERDALAGEARDLGIAGRVRFTGARGDAARLLRAFGVYVLCSTSEGMPITLVEAMAAALPIVATAVGGIPRLVEHGANGLLVPSGDEAALAESIVHLLRDRPLAARLGAEGRRRYLADYALERMVARYVTAFEGEPMAPDRVC